MNNPYEDLGISKDATPDEIKKAYRKKAKENHPDSGGDREKFEIVNKAWEILRDPDKRSYYDTHGKARQENRDIGVQLILSIFDGILSSDPPSHVNILKAIEDGLLEIIRAAIQAQHKFNKEIKKYEHQKNKFKGKKGKVLQSNIFQHLLDQKINDLKECVNKAEEAIINAKSAKKILKDYEYEPDSPDSMTFADMIKEAQANPGNTYTFFTRG